MNPNIDRRLGNPTEDHMRYQLTPFQCRPWTLSYLLVKLIESYYENNYGGALAAP